MINVLLYSSAPAIMINLLFSFLCHDNSEHEPGEGDADFVFEEFVRLRVAGMEENNETDA